MRRSARRSAIAWSRSPGASWHSGFALPCTPLMCGIVGYVGDRPCRDLLIAGLEKLEYRGYDSAGISVLSDGEIDSVRAVGNLANLRAAMEEQASNGGAASVAVASKPGTIGL